MSRARRHARPFATAIALASAAASLFAAVPAMAQSKDPRLQDAGTQGAAAPAQLKNTMPTAPAVDPAAVAAVNRMSDYLRALPMYSVRAETTTDEVLLAGPKVQFAGVIEGAFKAPDRLWMRIVRDQAEEQQFFYDGTTLSLWVEAKKVWASVPAPGTVGETIALVESKYDVTFPLGDLLALAVRSELLKDVKAGIVVGTGRVAGVECDHLAFHQDGIDWQLWIERGARPLPRKMVITTLGEPSQPQHTEVLTWDLAPKIDAATFTFTPPEGAQRIVIAERPVANGATVEKAAAPAGKQVPR